MRIRYLIISMLLTALIAGRQAGARAQTYTECIEIGDEAFGNGDYYTASVFYNNALWYDSTDLSVAWKCADAYRCFNNYTLSARWYRYVLLNDFRQEYPLSRFWYAMMLKSQGEDQQALELFKSYLQNTQVKGDDYYFRKSLIEVQACRDAPGMMSDPVRVMIEHLSESGVNTAYSEFNAVQLSDTALVFSALRPVLEGEYESYFANAYLSKIYIARTGVAGWTDVHEIDARINDRETHNANICFSPGFTRAWFTRSRNPDGNEMRTEIWYTENTTGKWQKPIKLSDKINAPGSNSTQPCFAPGKDFDLLFFSSDRPGGIGKSDLWYCIIKDGKYHDPVNLGSIVNTPGDEITPFYIDSLQTLYFSSDWHKGLGGFDIFYSKGKLNSWTKPVNIGFPVNSSCNDLYFTVNSVDNDGFFTSNRSGSFFIKSETCCNDIYSYEWGDTTRIKAVVQVEKSDTVSIENRVNALLPLTLYFHNDEPNPRSRDTVTTQNYQTLLSAYYAMKNTYREEYARGLSGKDKTKAEKDIDDFFENYVGLGFSNLKLFASLLYTDLNRGNDVRIKIKGYCSPLTTTEYNLNLAKRRISSIVNFLKEYNGGIFRPYLTGTALNGAGLTILSEPLGETTASTLVSDNPNDRRNSIYSRAAALERKIQIIMYDSEENHEEGGGNPSIRFSDTLHRFGSVVPGKKEICIFRFRNTGDAPLYLSGAETSCACLTADWSREAVLPGREAEITVFYTAGANPGKIIETVTLYSNAGIRKTILTITATVAAP